MDRHTVKTGHIANRRAPWRPDSAREKMAIMALYRREAST